jgi:two-component system response regulator PrrA
MRAGRRITLSGREYALLHTLLQNAERVLTRRQLLDLAWGRERDVASGAIDTYVSYLRRKIEDDGMGRILHTVRGVGYVLRGAERAQGGAERAPGGEA